MERLPCRFVSASVWVFLTLACAQQLNAAPVKPLADALKQQIAQDKQMPDNNAPVMRLYDIIVAGLNNSFEIDLAQSTLTQRSFETEEAEAEFYPKVSINGDIGYAYNEPFGVDTDEDIDNGDFNQPNSYGFEVNQMLFKGFANIAEVERREQLARSAELELRKTSQDIMYDTIQLYLTITRLQMQERDTIGYVKIMKTLFETVSAQEAGGAANVGDVKYTESRLAAAESQLVNLQSQISDNEAQLARITGPMKPFSGVFSSKLIIPASLQQSLTIAEQHNLVLNILESDEMVVDYANKSNDSVYYPTLELNMQGTQSMDVGGETGRQQIGSVRLALTQQLYDGGAASARRKRLKEQYNELELKKKLAKREIRQKLTTFYSRLRSIDEDVGLLEKELKASEKLFYVYLSEIQYDHGDVVQLAELQERMYDSLLKLTELRYEYSLLNFQVLREMGKLYEVICHEHGCQA